MKSICLMAFAALSSVGFLSAQESCMALFPKTKGAVLVNKGYDSQNHLLTTTTYTVQESYDYMSGSSNEINFSMTDSLGNVVDQGSLEARCDEGNFYMKLMSASANPNIVGMLAGNAELVGDFLDYPNTFNDDYPFDGNFAMEEGEFTVKSKSDKDNFARVNIRNRSYDKREKITTPAGTFDASKISYVFDVYNGKEKKTKTYKGVEWYAPSFGIVKSETYDNNNNLINRTELAEMEIK